MKGRTVLLVGCGDIGTRIGLALVECGCRVIAVRRAIEKLPAEIEAIGADYSEPGSLDFAAALKPDVVLTTFNPADRTEAGYRRGFTSGMENLLRGLGAHRPRHILMASSTRVYAEREGGWVDEQSDLSGQDVRALAIIDAENVLLESGHSASVVRFAGIYGNPGGRLVSRIRGGEIAPAEPVRYTNRIHREDCAGFLLHLIARIARGEPVARVYVGVDDEPAARHEVESWIAERLGVAVTKVADIGAGGHKRCSNTLLKESGYGLRYPDFKSGYAALLQ